MKKEETVEKLKEIVSRLTDIVDAVQSVQSDIEETLSEIEDTGTTETVSPNHNHIDSYLDLADGGLLDSKEWLKEVGMIE